MYVGSEHYLNRVSLFSLSLPNSAPGYVRVDAELLGEDTERPTLVQGHRVSHHKTDHTSQLIQCQEQPAASLED